MNTGVEVMRGNLQSWSWGDITRIYAILGGMLEQYNGVHQRIKVPKPNIKYSDHENIFFLRFWGDVRRINEQLQALDAEIARRNRLIGVIG
jgi:hypothetical protein